MRSSSVTLTMRATRALIRHPADASNASVICHPAEASNASAHLSPWRSEQRERQEGPRTASRQRSRYRFPKSRSAPFLSHPESTFCLRQLLST